MTIIHHAQRINITDHESRRPEAYIKADRLELQFDNPQELAEFVTVARLTLQASWLNPNPPSLWLPI